MRRIRSAFPLLVAVKGSSDLTASHIRLNRLGFLHEIPLKHPHPMSITCCVEHTRTVCGGCGNQDQTRTKHSDSFMRLLAKHNCHRDGDPMSGHRDSNALEWFWHM